MKKTTYIIILLGLASFFSCDDLDQYPQSFQPIKEYYEKNGAVAAELSSEGLAVTLWQSNYGVNCRLQRIGLGADGVTTLKDSDMKYINDLIPRTASNNADVAPIWGALTKVIYDANILIKFAQVKSSLTDPVKIEGEKKRIAVAKGEAAFMRGLAYFYMVRLFGNAPLILDNEEDAKADMPLSTPEDIYIKVIIPSLKIATADLPNVGRLGNSALPSKWAAKALLADVYITMAGWPLNKGTEYYTLAAQEANGIITNEVESKLSLTPKYADLWKESLKKNTNEHLFALHHSVTNKNPSQYGKSYYPADYYPNGGWSDYFANLEFFLTYPDDERKDWNYTTEWLSKVDGIVKTIQYTEALDKTPLISKFADYDDGEHGKNALSNGLTPIYRYAEVLLIYAEASVKASGTVSTAALAALNRVQERAAPKDAAGVITSSAGITTSTDPVVFEKAVFDEYGWEFLGEPKRWFQLVRKEKLSQVRADKWGASLFKENNHYYLPIPSEQIELTGWTNNPGY